MTSPDVYEGTDNLEAMLQAHRYTAFLSELIKHHAPNQGTVLDFGAGIGTFAKTFDLSSYNIVCVEPDGAQRTILNALGYQVHESIKSVAANSCDYIYSLNVLEHIEDDAAAAAELYRVLKPGATCLIYVPALSALYSAMDRKVGHHRRYGLSGLKSILRSAGFQVERAQYADSIGVFATLAYKAFGNDNGSLNVTGLKLYDRFIFPLSRILDTIASPFFGKNVYALVRKPMDNAGNP